MQAPHNWILNKGLCSVTQGQYQKRNIPVHGNRIRHGHFLSDPLQNFHRDAAERAPQPRDSHRGSWPCVLRVSNSAAQCCVMLSLQIQRHFLRQSPLGLPDPLRSGQFTPHFRLYTKLTYVGYLDRVEILYIHVRNRFLIRFAND